MEVRANRHVLSDRAEQFLEQILDLLRVGEPDRVGDIEPIRAELKKLLRALHHVPHGYWPGDRATERCRKPAGNDGLSLRVDLVAIRNNLPETFQ